MDETLYIRDVPLAAKERRSRISDRTIVMVGSNGNLPEHTELAPPNVFLANAEVTGHLLASFLIAVDHL